VAADLLASCWTTAGPAKPLSPDERSPFPLDRRIGAAAEAGFVGFGLLHADLIDAEERHGLAWVAHQLARSGIRFVELEMLNDWFTDGPRRAASDRVRSDLLRAAEELGALHIKVGGETDGTAWEWPLLVDAFGRLCADAARAGTRIAVEPMPFGQIRDLDTGRRLIDDAADDRGGLMLDLCHMARAGVDLADIAALPARFVFGVELDDADREPHGTLLDDTLDHRRLCGEGELDVIGFIRAVRAAGFVGPWGVEILSHEFRRLSLDDQVARAFTTTSTQLALAEAAASS
jgi:sugar phosphate isomerase/epimerase